MSTFEGLSGKQVSNMSFQQPTRSVKFCQNMAMPSEPAPTHSQQYQTDVKKAPIYGTHERIVPEVSPLAIHYDGHCPILAGNPGMRPMYDELG